MTGVRAALIALGCCLSAQAFAEAPRDMSDAAARIDQARQALAEASDPAGRIGALGEAIAAYQSALDVIRAGVRGAGSRERDLTLALETQRVDIQHLIAALEAMSRTPPPAQALHPQGPLGAARAAAMMARITPALRAEADQLRSEYDNIAAVRTLRLQGEQELREGIAALGAARSELAETVARHAPPQPRGTEDPALGMMVRDSDTLTTLAGKLARTSASSSDAPMPTLRPPVAGEVLRAYDQPDAAGVRRPGVVFAAPPLSLVKAPADAIVRYAGPFLEYGYVVVLESDGDTLIVLAGLAQVQVSTGDAVRAGDLLGLLGGPVVDPDPGAGGADAASTSGADETLYVEVRHGQGPVDPLPLFSGDKG